MNHSNSQITVISEESVTVKNTEQLPEIYFLIYNLRRMLPDYSGGILLFYPQGL